MIERGRPGVLMVVVLLGVGFFAGRMTSDRDDGGVDLGIGFGLGAGLTVNGTGEVTAKPDFVTASFTVEAGGSSGDALREGNDRTAQLVEAVEAKGVDAKDVQTDAAVFDGGFGAQGSFPPGDGEDFAGPPGAPGAASVSGNLSVEVRIRDLGAAQETIDAALGVEGVTLGRVVLSLDKGGKRAAEARRLAVDDAREQAEQLARAAGRKLGKVVSVGTGSPFEAAYPFEEDGYPDPDGQGLPLGDSARTFQMKLTVIYELR